jgi:hypothetical protein
MGRERAANPKVPERRPGRPPRRIADEDEDALGLYEPELTFDLARDEALAYVRGCGVLGPP